MTVNKTCRYLLIIVLGIWGIVTCAALAGMYTLWWDRERVHYLGKSPSDQRLIVWRNAGLPKKLLSVADAIEKTWPAEIAYSASGNRNELSYLKYLVIPRLPTGSAIYSVDAAGRYVPNDLPPSGARQQHRWLPVSGFLGSLLTVLGLSLSLQSQSSRISFSLAEMCGCVCLLLMGCIILSRSILGTAVPSFFLLAVAGAGSWIGLVMTRAGRQVIIRRFERLSGDRIRRSSARPGEIAGSFFLIGVIVCSLIWVILMSVIVVPDDWDAWAIWGAKAKILALGRGPLLDVSYFGHADYPLLWPSVWAFSGWLGGGWEEMWSRGWGAVFFCFCLSEIIVIIERETGNRILGWAGAAVFASVPMTPLIASWSYAEAPFWMMTVSSVGCIMLWRGRSDTICLIVAAVLATGAAYTKNEGILFSLLVSFWLLLTPGKNVVRAWGVFATVFLFLYLPWFVWIKIIQRLGSHATTGLHLDSANILRVMERIPKAIASIFSMWSDIQRWNIVLWTVGVMMIFAIVQGKFRRDLIVPCGMLLGYFVIIIFHTDNIYWQIGASWDRLSVQILPLLLVVLVPGIWHLCSSGCRDEM